MTPKVVYQSKWLRFINRWPAAMTLYPFLLFKWTRDEVARSPVFRHELEHFYVAQKMGPVKFYLSYMWNLIRHGYKRNPYEVAADAVENTPLTDEEKAWRDGPESKAGKTFDWALCAGFMVLVATFLYSLMMMGR